MNNSVTHNTTDEKLNVLSIMVKNHEIKTFGNDSSNEVKLFSGNFYKQGCVGAKFAYSVNSVGNEVSKHSELKTLDKDSQVPSFQVVSSDVVPTANLYYENESSCARISSYQKIKISRIRNHFRVIELH